MCTNHVTDPEDPSFKHYCRPDLPCSIHQANPEPLKVKQVQKILSAMGISFRRTEAGDFRTVRRGRPEIEANYTDDLEDALLTGRFEAARDCSDCSDEYHCKVHTLGDILPLHA